MRRILATTAALVAATALTACSSEDDKPSITIYNAQHQELIEEMAPGFTKETGIEVELRNGSDFELANQLVQEGSASPADVFLTENSPAMSLVQSKGLFAPVDAKTLAQVPEQYSPSDGEWMGFAARSTVVAYNTDKVKEADLPASILDLAKPEWKGKISFSPSGADFQAIVSAVLETKGEAATKAWLDGIKANGTVYQGNNVVLESVNAGEVDAGVIYHYYWYRDQAESGENSDNTKLHFFGDKDPGAFVSVSGAGVLKSSKKQADAQKFLAYISGEKGQQALADSYALEYPLNPAVSLKPPVKPFSELDPPVIDVAKLNGPRVISLLQGVGFL
ncbi:MAG: iron ABC transporter substrate-binding protein [Actinomycetota bacterium]|nr:iron ABC transporter substrate-binding protein [Actinomycetota bacterium]